MATLVQLGPAQDLMRAINSPLGANTNTCPSEACATNSRPALSIVRPSGPLAPKVEQKRPTLETLPSFINGKALSLVGKIDLAIRRDVQIVAPLEGFGIARRQHRLHPSRLCIELHNAVHVVGDKDASIGADLQTVGPAVIFCHQRPFAVRRDPKNATERNIDDVE